MEDILYLEPDEEITSVIDKIKQSKSNRLALVVPREATLLQSVVNLKLLAKEANTLGKEIAIVTADKIGRNLASQVGLVVYDSIKDRRPIFQPPAPTPKGSEEIIEIDLRKEVQEEEPKPKGVSVHHFQEERPVARRETPKPIHTPWQTPKIRKDVDWAKTRKIIWPMLGIVVLLVLIGAFMILPKVTVKIKVKAEDYQKTLASQIASGQATDIDKKIFAGNLIDLAQEKEDKFIATGKKNLGGKASGTLTLYNYWDSSAQSLSVGTKFSSSSKTFVSKGAVSIPGTSIRGGNIVPGTATVDIEAENPGEDSNVKAGRFTIVGLSSAQQEKIYGQSSKDLAGGFSKEVTVVSQSDLDQAKDKLSKDLTGQLQQELFQKAGTSEVLEKAVQNETVEALSSAKIDAEAIDFTMKVKQRLKVMVFDKSAFDNFTLQVLGKELSDDQMISLGPAGSINAAKIEPKYDQEILNLEVAVSAKVSARVDTEKVKKDLLGKNKSVAGAYLNNLKGIAGFEMNFVPSFWLKRIPSFGRSLKVELEYVESNPTPAAEVSPSILPTVNPEVLFSPEVSP